MACSIQAELGQMTATVYYDVNSVALDSKLLILQNTFTYRIQHESHQSTSTWTGHDIAATGCTTQLDNTVTQQGSNILN